MKSYRIPIDDFLADDRVKDAFLKSAKGKRNRADVAKVLENLEHHIEIVINMLREGEFVPPEHKDVIINESSYQKERTIKKPDYKYEQVVHHIAVSGIKESIEHGMYSYVLGSVPGRGAHLGKKYIERWLRRDPVNTKYVFKMDIRHFFQSVNHRVLKKWLKKKFRDKYILDLLFLIIDACDEGLPLGYYTSQWFANFLLQPLDHYIKEQLHVKMMQRYMDDIVCFGSNKRQLHRVKDAINEYLEKELHLTMKDNWQIFRFEYEVEEIVITCKSLKELNQLDAALDMAKIKHKSKMEKGKRKIFIRKSALRNKSDALNSLMRRYRATGEERISTYGRALDFMGFEFHRNKTVMRKGIMIRTVRKANRIHKAPKVCWKVAASFLSSIGWIKATNSYKMYTEKIKPIVNVKTMKKIVSKHQRRANNENKVDNSGGLQPGKTGGG